MSGPRADTFAALAPPGVQRGTANRVRPMTSVTCSIASMSADAVSRSSRKAGSSAQSHVTTTPMNAPRRWPNSASRASVSAIRSPSFEKNGLKDMSKRTPAATTNDAATTANIAAITTGRRASRRSCSQRKMESDLRDMVRQPFFD